MIYWLATACRTARLRVDVRQSRIANTLHDLGGPSDQSSVARFERGEAWPRDADLYVDAYAAATEVSDPRDLWATALALYYEYGATEAQPAQVAEAVERELAGAVAATRRSSGGTAGKRRGRRSQ